MAPIRGCLTSRRRDRELKNEFGFAVLSREKLQPRCCGWRSGSRWITIEGKLEPAKSKTLSSLISRRFQETRICRERGYVLIRRKINHRVFSSKGDSF